MHRVSILKGPLSMYSNVIKLSMMSNLNHLHSSSDVTSLYVTKPRLAQSLVLVS
jgi:hypothetical protein